LEMLISVFLSAKVGKQITVKTKTFAFCSKMYSLSKFPKVISTTFSVNLYQRYEGYTAVDVSKYTASLCRRLAEYDIHWNMKTLRLFFCNNDRA